MEYEIVDIDAIECVGMYEDEYVYDIEMEDDTEHTFFANDILVHNSMYLTFNELMNKLGVENTYTRRLKITRFLMEMTKKRLTELNEKHSMARFNSKNLISFSSELIADTALFCAKKKYCAHMVEKDGIPTDELLVKGLDIVRSNCPARARKTVEEVVKAILAKTSYEDIQKMSYSIYNDFMKWPLDDIALPKACNNLNNFACEELAFIKGCPQHMKAAITFNYLRDKYKLAEYEPIKEGDKFYMLNLKSNKLANIECIGYKTKIPKEFKITEDMVDRKRHFELAYVSPLKLIFNALGWYMEDFANKREKVNDLFD